jgi:hypothetical protein
MSSLTDAINALTSAISNGGSVGPNNVTTVAGDNSQVNLANPGSIALIAHGSNNSIFLSGISGGSVDDKGTNLLLRISGAPTSTLTIRDFQSDPGGVLQLSNTGYASTQQALAALTPDGSGGTMLPMSTGGRIDFAGESAQQLVGHLRVVNA